MAKAFIKEWIGPDTPVAEPQAFYTIPFAGKIPNQIIYGRDDLPRFQKVEYPLLTAREWLKRYAPVTINLIRVLWRTGDVYSK